ncbi:MAG: type II toxin-antitoxin system prevent-host-death family antitoxin [Gemmatimonadota bacterium]|nr:type II toxin-antitoxin system prevent-host-death family antitoxin [Gemmatimonadota bacterium]MDE2870080.1 type II toxin-antitoxin system prevent-host-death family antitoxin [Gemmatimonadota bacterium]
MFQTGYLTIVDSQFRAGRRFHRLGYPNLEVRLSLHSSLLAFLTDHRAPEPGSGRLLEGVLRDGDFAALESEIRALFASIPYEWHARNELARYEGYHASVFHSFLVGSGLRVRVEDSSAAGRLDLAVVVQGAAFLFELKVAERASAGAALAQLRERGYAEKYRRPGRTVQLVGIHFSEKTPQHRGVRGGGGVAPAPALDSSGCRDQTDTMTTVSISDLEANLSRYLRHVRRGGEVQILDRGVPVARLIGPRPGCDAAVRDRLVGDGLLRPRKGTATSILDSPPLELPTSISQALAEDRTDRL